MLTTRKTKQTRISTKPPALKTHKGRAVVSFRGQKIDLGKAGSEKAEADYQRIVEQWKVLRAERDGQTKIKPSIVATVRELRQRHEEGGQVYLAELARVYIDYAKTYYQKNGRVTREAEMVEEVWKFACHHYGLTPVDKFGPVLLKDLRELMIDEKDWVRRHINKQVGRLVRGFAYGVEEEIVSAQTHQALKVVRGLKKGRCRARENLLVQPVPDDVVEATLEYLTPVAADMVRFQRLTGARPGETCSIRPCDVDRTNDTWKYTPDEHKTEHHEKERTIFIGPKAQDILRPYLLRGAKSFCFSPKESERLMREARAAKRRTPGGQGNRPGTNIRNNPKRKPGDCYTTGSYRRAIQRAAKKAGQPRWAPNQLRHSAATEIRKNYGLEASQVVLGHSAADVTQIYAERDHALAARVAQEVG